MQYDGDALAASVRAAEQSGVRYAVSDVNLKDSVYGGVELTGRIRNDTADRGSLVCVAAVLLDESEKPLGVVYTVLGSPLEAGTETTFGMSSEMLPPEVKSADIAQVETFAHPLVEKYKKRTGSEIPTRSVLYGTQTLKRKLTMSPSFMTYSLPSLRTRPFAFAAAMVPQAFRSSKAMTSARMKPRSKSLWILPAACGARVPF